MQNAKRDADAARTEMESLRSQLTRQVQLNKMAKETTMLHCNACMSYKAKAWQALGRDAAAADARVALQSALAQCEAELAEAVTKPECVVCMDAAATMVLTPCGHLCGCEGCDLIHRLCPICRGGVESKVFLRYV